MQQNVLLGERKLPRVFTTLSIGQTDTSAPFTTSILKMKLVAKGIMLLLMCHTLKQTFNEIR